MLLQHQEQTVVNERCPLTAKELQSYFATKIYQMEGISLPDYGGGALPVGSPTRRPQNRMDIEDAIGKEKIVNMAI